MIDFSQFKVERYEPNREEVNGYALIMPVIDGLGSMVINLLLYRLNNLSDNVVLYITDNNKVTKNDVANGVYVNSDIGVKRAEAITDKYSGYFDNVTIVDVVKKADFKRDDLDELSILYIDLSSEGKFEEDFDSLLGNQMSVSKFTRNNFYLSHQTKGMKDVIRYKAVSLKLIESKEDIEVDERRVMKRDKYIKNILASRLIVSTLNNIITEGRNLNYQEVAVNMIDYNVMEKKDIERED